MCSIASNEMRVSNERKSWVTEVVRRSNISLFSHCTQRHITCLLCLCCCEGWYIYWTSHLRHRLMHFNLMQNNIYRIKRQRHTCVLVLRYNKPHKGGFLDGNWFALKMAGDGGEGGRSADVWFLCWDFLFLKKNQIGEVNVRRQEGVEALGAPHFHFLNTFTFLWTYSSFYTVSDMITK